jgi:hypothetical protein
MKNRIEMWALALVATLALLPGAARAADEVKLSYAELRQVSSSGGSLEGSVEVKNLAYAKQLAVVYSINGGEWREASAGYSAASAPGFERWSFQVQPVTYGVTLRFALRYRVAGQEFWDNNGGADYRIGGNAPGFVLGHAAVKLDRASVSSSRAGVYVIGDVVVKNLAYGKEVKVVYSFDEWATVHEAFASYTSELSNSGGTAERWGFSLPVQPPGSQRTVFAIAYTVDGVTYWDNNHGANYAIAWGEVIN